MIQHRQPGQSSSFFREFAVVPARSGIVFIESAEEPRLGASFDRENSATRPGRAVSGAVGARTNLARHAVKCAE